ncbi:MAG: transglutaminase-like domain-containing protein [Microgenomates group bacterium]|jgi:hypothetical protein
MLRKFILIFLLFLIFVVLPKNVSAASEFETDYKVSYDVTEDGVTQVAEKITLTNLTETYYASTFVLTIGSTSLGDVSAIDGGGVMEAKSEVKDNKTVVTLKFNEQITGIDKTQTFTLKYKSNDFALKIGKNWEVNLPRIHEGEDIKTFNVALSVPLSFGEPTSITPKPKSESDGAGKLVLNFTKDQLANSGVSVNFGSNQVFDFNLKYNLNNNSFFPTVVSISLPMNTNYQDVLINSINPKPLNVTTDLDGNYLAWYQIQKRSSEQVTVSGSVKLYINPKTNTTKLTKAQVSGLTKSDKYWERDNPSIKAVNAEIFKNGKPKTTEEQVHQIYQYLVNTLKYNSAISEQTRLGALTSLSNLDRSKALEFTDLFIALVRADGIPARGLDGIAYSQNKTLRPLSLIPDVTHSWTEYFDEHSGWVMVDPTWEQTSGGVDYFNKLDLNHFVINIRGESSTSPTAATVAEMTVSPNEFAPNSSPQIDLDVKPELWVGLPGIFKVIIQNNGSITIPSNSINISAGRINLLDSKEITVDQIPPFGSTTFDVNFRTPFLNEYTTDEIVVNYMGKQYTKKVALTPFFLLSLLPYLFRFAVFLVVFMYFLVLGVHAHKRRKR